MIWAILILGLLIGLLPRYTIVKEGTAKAIMTLGEFSRIVFRWKGHWLDKEGRIWRDGELPQDIMEEKNEGETDEDFKKRLANRAKEFREANEERARLRVLGGLFICGIRGIHQVHNYPLRWADVHQIEEAGQVIEKPVFHDEKALDYAMLRPTVYYTKLIQVETGTPLWLKKEKPALPERIGVDVEVLVTMRIINPYNFLFVAPSTPVEEVIARLNALIRATIGMMDLDSLMFYRGKSDMLWHGSRDEKTLSGLPLLLKEQIGEYPGLKDEKLIRDTLPKWGLAVAEAGVDIKKVDTPPDIRDLIRARRQQELLAEARGARIAGTLVETEAQGRGKTKEEIQKEINDDDGRRAQFREDTKDLITRELTMERGALTRIEVPGGTTLEGLVRLFGGKLPLGTKEGGLPQVGESRTKESAEAGGATGKPSKQKVGKPGVRGPSGFVWPKEMAEEDRERLRDEFSELPKEERDKRVNEMMGLMQDGKIRRV